MVVRKDTQRKIQGIRFNKVSINLPTGPGRLNMTGVLFLRWL